MTGALIVVLIYEVDFSMLFFNQNHMHTHVCVCVGVHARLLPHTGHGFVMYSMFIIHKPTQKKNKRGCARRRVAATDDDARRHAAQLLLIGARTVPGCPAAAAHALSIMFRARGRAQPPLMRSHKIKFLKIAIYNSGMGTGTGVLSSLKGMHSPPRAQPEQPPHECVCVCNLWLLFVGCLFECMSERMHARHLDVYGT